MSKGIIKPIRKVRIISSAAVVGKEESEGPLGNSFDFADTKDDKFGKDTWEKAESEMQHRTFGIALSKAELNENDIDGVFAGDLLNQCVGSNYGLAKYRIPYFGLYGACSTAAEGLLLASVLASHTESRYASITSSHYCSAERQFRFPLDYGAQRTPTSQWTVTGSGAFILSSCENDTDKFDENEYIPVVTEVLAGCVTDKGITDVNNMGAAMAPAAADTLLRYFSTSRKVRDFDLIITGDLGVEGSGILKDLLKIEGIDISRNHVDCGKLIYCTDDMDKHAGGSGCGCSASVMAGHFMKNLRAGDLKNVLFVGTGALMSPLVLNQGATIPGIAHLVRIEVERR